MSDTTLNPVAILDGNEAAALVAYKLSEVIAIYPITPSSGMGELSDDWAAHGQVNLWGTVPTVIEMQSEGGAAGAVHGALQAGSPTTTFTASQGLLLMIPNMYKIAGELTPFAMHVTARTIATHALSIFGDHSDVMACRQTGFAMLCGGSVQEAHDFALISHAATLRTRIPFLHFFDGFRTSHELQKITLLPEAVLHALVPPQLIAEQRARGLTPDHPVLRGSAQNPDVFFQAREACNPFYDRCAGIVQDVMDLFGAQTGRNYKLFDYVGAPDAERVIIMMGSGAEAAEETVEHLVAQGEKVGLVRVRLFRPFDRAALLQALPQTTKAIAVLDRTKEPGAAGEPLYQDILTVLHEARAEGETQLNPLVIGGRYGLSSKEFAPAHVKAVYDELKKPKKLNHFTVGILDDVTFKSLAADPDFDLEPSDVVRAMFYGLGADGTVGANKNSIKIIGEETDQYAQGYFVYDSKKSGTVTTSHMRFGPRPIRSTYQIRKANFVAVHQWNFFEKLDMLEHAAQGATVLINSPYAPNELFDHLPSEVQLDVLNKNLKLFTIDALEVARANDMGKRINTVMQTCFFAISGVLPRDEAIERIKKSIEKTYGKKGSHIVARNFAAVDDTLAQLYPVPVPQGVTALRGRPPVVPAEAPDFVQRVTATMLAARGDTLPVSVFAADGTWPTATSKWEKRGIATEIPVWDPAVCIQCNKCAMVCPHAAIRASVFDPKGVEVPGGFASIAWKGPEFAGYQYVIQVAPDDCTGCTVCAMVCPAKDKTNPSHKALDMHPVEPLLERERSNFDFYKTLPPADRSLTKGDVKGTQLLEPLMEFSGACSGCGETPYLKLLTQLSGDRLVIANATGCSSIYGGNLPTTPYAQTAEGRGPAWANSLFEDNAEFGLGMRLSLSQQAAEARRLLQEMAGEFSDLADGLLADSDTDDEAAIARQRPRVAELKRRLTGRNDATAKRLLSLADNLVRRVLWIVGGDGWAYDIGFGGLDHVMASGADVNILVLDTEVYSNTGGQASKSTPMGAAAKFAAAGKSSGKKDLGMIAMSYGNVYVAQVAFGARDAQTVKAIQEAQAWRGPSIVIAYSHCIAHGYDMAYGPEQQKLAVQTGYWPLFRYDPRNALAGEAPLHLDSTAPKGDLKSFVGNETRFKMVEQADPVRYGKLMAAHATAMHKRFALYEHMAKIATTTPHPDT